MDEMGPPNALAPLENPRLRAPNGGRMPSQDELPIRPRPTLFFLGVKLVVWGLIQGLFSVRTKGSRRLRRNLRQAPKDKPVIFIANHLSMLDGPLLAALLPAKPRVHFIAAGEILTKNRKVWWLVKRIGGVFPVDRSATAGKAIDFDAVYEALRRPRPISLLIFPEGRLGEVEGRINHQPKSGATRFAMNTDATVIPIGITGTTRVWFRRRLNVNYGDPVQYDPGMTIEQRLERETVAIQNLIEPYRARFGPKFLQWAFPQKRKQRAGWMPERDGWNVERVLPEFLGDGADVLGTTGQNRGAYQAPQESADLTGAPGNASHTRRMEIQAGQPVPPNPPSVEARNFPSPPKPPGRSLDT